MFKKVVAIGVAAAVLLGPAVVLLSIAVVMNPAANAACTIGTGNGAVVGQVPDSLDVTAADGTTFTLNRAQLTHAATIINIGNSVEGIDRDGIQIALMAALTESTLRMLSNTTAYPESANYPNDGDGADNDSLGLFQMRPAAGWGSVADLMDPSYQARAFYGGPTGPNYPSPRGLLDIPGWKQMDKGAAAQAVEVSAHPDRYRNYEPVAQAILNALTAPSGPAGSIDLPAVVTAPINGQIAVAHANIPNRTSQQRFASSMGWLTGQDPDFITLNEVSARSLDAIRAQAPGYAAYRHHQVDGNQSQGNVVLWKTGVWTKLDAGRIKIVEDDKTFYNGKKVTWDRFATWALLQRDDGAVVSIVSVHHMTNPHKFTRQHGNPAMTRPEQYGQGMDTLVGLLDQLGGHGPVFVGGDMNTHASYTNLGWSAAAKMKDAGYAWHNNGVDFIFYQPANGVKLANGVVGPKAEAGDHNMIAATFNLNRAGTTTTTSAATRPVADTSTIVPAAATTAQGPESSRVVFPLPADTWVMSSPYGMRTHPVTGEHKLHTGTDFSAPAGTPILAAADGTVTFAGPSPGYGNLIVVEHTISGQTVATAYAHMEGFGIHVAIGDQVTAGQHIGDVGSSGYSTGPHLHFEVRPGGTSGAPVDPVPWLNSHGAADLPSASPASPGGAGCEPAATPGEGGTPAPFEGDDPDALVPDPTSDGQITARTAHVLAQVRAAFPDSSWACWAPRPGTDSEHPKGRACDATFGNAIGQPATGESLHAGWAVTDWLKTHAELLGVEYLIWQGRIWSLARADEGWRSYTHPSGESSPTLDHDDHLHLTVKAG